MVPRGADSVTAATDIKTTKSIITLGAWSYLVITYEKSTGALKVYVNEVLEETLVCAAI